MILHTMRTPTLLALAGLIVVGLPLSTFSASEFLPYARDLAEHGIIASQDTES